MVIDEVQRVPELLNVVHDLIERHPGLPFVPTGSSARKLCRGGVNLLAGRALYRTLHPFMAAELSIFSLDAALVDGLLPVVVAATRPADVVKAYATLYLEKEVRLEGWARNVSSFARFLEAVSFSHAAVLNISNVARECQIERKTVAGYIEVLEDLLLSFRLPVFTRRARRRTSGHPKFFFFRRRRVSLAASERTARSGRGDRRHSLRAGRGVLAEHDAGARADRFRQVSGRSRQPVREINVGHTSPTTKHAMSSEKKKCPRE